MNTNLEKIVAILDVLMFRVRRLKKPYATMPGMDETTHTIIIKTFDRILNGIAQIREQFENGSQPVPDEHAEATALALVLYSVQYGEKVIGGCLHAWVSQKILTHAVGSAALRTRPG